MREGMTLEEFGVLQDLLMARYIGLSSSVQFFEGDNELTLVARVSVGADTFRIEQIFYDNGITETIVWRDQDGVPVDPHQIVNPIDLELIGLPGDFINLTPP